ncbi:unnamed protein product, partial [Rotaria sp. Silwood1]
MYRIKLHEFLNKMDLKQKLETEEHIDTYVAALTESIVLATKEAVPLADEKIRRQLMYQNTIANNDQEKANLFASYLENEVFISKPDETPFHNQVNTQAELIKRKMKTEIYSRKNKSLPITVKEVKSILKQLPNSAPGPDIIHNRSLKNYTKLLLIHL